jgi:hypothetical protein
LPEPTECDKSVACHSIFTGPTEGGRRMLGAHMEVLAVLGVLGLTALLEVLGVFTALGDRFERSKPS